MKTDFGNFNEQTVRDENRNRQCEIVSSAIINKHPHQSIGLLCVNRTGRPPVIATAFLISKDLILTAAHNLNDVSNQFC